MQRLRIFGSHLSRSQRRVYGAVVVFYLFAAVAMTWPVYAVFSRARPLILGMPLSLVYLAGFVLASFAVLFAMYRWEARQPPAPTDGDPADEDPADGDGRDGSSE